MAERKPNDRVLRLIATARKHPEFAQHVAMQLPEQLRLEFVQELAKPEVAVPKPAVRPGVKKCAQRPQIVQSGLTAQLNLFARSVSRVS